MQYIDCDALTSEQHANLVKLLDANHRNGYWPLYECTKFPDGRVQVELSRHDDDENVFLTTWL